MKKQSLKNEKLKRKTLQAGCASFFAVVLALSSFSPSACAQALSLSKLENSFTQNAELQTAQTTQAQATQAQNPQAQATQAADLTDKDTGIVTPIEATSTSCSASLYTEEQDNPFASTNPLGDSSGTTGECSWTFESATGTLTVVGNSSTTTNSFPWEDQSSPLCFTNPNNIRAQIKAVTFTNPVSIPTAKNMFQSCYNLASADLTNLEFDTVSSLDGMFFKCYPLTSVDFHDKNLSHVTSLYATFAGDYTGRDPKLKMHITSIDFSGTDLSNVTSLQNTFSGCIALSNLNFPSTLSNKLTRIDGFLDTCMKLPSFDCSLIPTENITNMSGALAGLSQIQTLDIRTWDTKNVTDMSNLFSGCGSLQEIKGLEHLNTQNVITMEKMFTNCKSLPSLDVTNFDTSNVTNVNLMFAATACKTINVTGWDLKNLKSMNGTFQENQAIEELDLSSWDVSQVAQMNQLFMRSKNLKNPHIEHWNPACVEEIQFFFDGTANLDPSLLRIFSRSPIVDISGLFEDSEYESLDLSPFAGKKIRYMAQAFCNMHNLKQVDFSLLDTSAATNLTFAFSSLENIDKLDFSHHDFSHVTSLWCTFSSASCSEILLPSKPFGTACTSFKGAFGDCTELKELNLTSMDIRAAEDVSQLFDGCTNLEKIYVSPATFIVNFSQLKIDGDKNVFSENLKLQGEYGTTYDPAHTDAAYAVIDGGPASVAPGYLSQGFEISSNNLQTDQLAASYSYTGAPLCPHPTFALWVDKVMPQATLSSAEKPLPRGVYPTQHTLMPLIEGVNYTLTYTNNTEPGTASIEINGLGRFNSSATVTFEITQNNTSEGMGTLLPATGDTTLFARLQCLR